jgi:glycerol-3-phosphate dehydrogenase
MKTARIINLDTLIIGGGVSGLWLLNRLQQAGYHCVLLEQNQLGGGQTAYAQGIIHGGLKYALNGRLNTASHALAEMPQRWLKCFTSSTESGLGEIDLTQVKLLAKRQYLCSTNHLGSRLAAFFARQALRSGVEPVPQEDYPDILQHPDFQGAVYALQEQVVDVFSLLEQLSKPWYDHIYQAKWSEQWQWVRDQKKQVNGVAITTEETQLHLKPQAIVLCAGENNEALLNSANLAKPKMQRRPLHMITVKHSALTPLYAHFLGTGQKPKVTISSHPCADGQSLWYLGGELAETGVDKSCQQQIKRAKQEIYTLMPWLDLDQGQWSSFMVNRAEPQQLNRLKPDNPFARQIGRLIVTWPTKLALSPGLADRVIDLLMSTHKPGITKFSDVLKQLPLDRPTLAKPPWEASSP